MSCKKTFTLIELLAVFALLTVIAALLTQSGVNLIQGARANRDFEKFQSFLSEVEAIAYLYKVDLKVELLNTKKGLECKLLSAPDHLLVLEKRIPLKLKLLKLSKADKQTLNFRPENGWVESGSFIFLNTKNLEFSLQIEPSGIKKRNFKAA